MAFGRFQCHFIMAGRYGRVELFIPLIVGTRKRRTVVSYDVSTPAYISYLKINFLTFSHWCAKKGFSMTIFSYTHTTNCIYRQLLSLPYFHFPFDSLLIFKQTSPFHYVCICIYMYIHMRACFNLDICKKEISFLPFYSL